MAQTESPASTWVQEARKGAGLLIGVGVVTAIAGFLALGSPWVAGVGVALLVGVAMVIGGIGRLIAAFGAASFGQGTLAFIGGALAVVVGVVIAGRPGVALATLTLMLAVYLLVDGVFGCILAFGVRPEKGWGWMLFSGCITVLLAILLLREWPLSGLWAVGTLVGINLLFGGFSLISLGTAVRSETPPAEEKE